MEKIPELKIPYSDHEGVEAIFTFTDVCDFERKLLIQNIIALYYFILHIYQI